MHILALRARETCASCFIKEDSTVGGGCEDFIRCCKMSKGLVIKEIRKMNNIKKAERDLEIYKLVDIRVYSYRKEPFGWINDPIGIIINLEKISHYYSWEDELEVYYMGKNSKKEEIIFKGITYYWKDEEYERGEWSFAFVDYYD